METLSEFPHCEFETLSDALRTWAHNGLVPVASVPQASPEKFRLAEFGAVVLEIMESEKEWSMDTMDEICREAYQRGLAADDETGAFKRQLSSDALNLSKCDRCGAEVAEIVGCPDGAEVCPACFKAGAH